MRPRKDLRRSFALAPQQGPALQQFTITQFVPGGLLPALLAPWTYATLDSGLLKHTKPPTRPGLGSGQILCSLLVGAPILPGDSHWLCSWLCTGIDGRHPPKLPRCGICSCCLDLHLLPLVAFALYFCNEMRLQCNVKQGSRLIV